jgi:hypothetical protein
VKSVTSHRTSAYASGQLFSFSASRMPITESHALPVMRGRRFQRDDLLQNLLRGLLRPTEFGHLRSHPQRAVCRFRGRNFGINGRIDRDFGLSAGKSISTNYPLRNCT